MVNIACKKKCRYSILQRFINLYRSATCYLFMFVYCVIAQVIHVFAILVMYLTHSNTPHEVCHRHTKKTRVELVLLQQKWRQNNNEYRFASCNYLRRLLTCNCVCYNIWRALLPCVFPSMLVLKRHIQKICKKGHKKRKGSVC